MSFTATECRICGSGGPHRLFTAKERQFGMGDSFDYCECAGCGSLQIVHIPSDLGRFYPEHYYSFQHPQDQDPRAISKIRRFFRARRSLYGINETDPIGFLIDRLGSDYFPYPWAWFRDTGVVPSSRILDVGCGSGALLRALRGNGFTRLYGVDPFIPNSIIETSLTIIRGELKDLSGEFDLVMFHHSLEHMPNPRGALEAAKRLCRPNGAVLVRIPVVDGFGWRVYGSDWIALDAPRHLVIPTKAGLSSLAVQCGLRPRSVVSDSESVGIWGSELYRRNLPLFRADGRSTIDTANPFTPEEMREFQRQTHDYNSMNDGDLARFIFINRNAAQ